jgi:hypothetical protein
MFVCSNSDMELKPEAPKPPPKLPDLRSELLTIWNIVQVAKQLMDRKLKFRDMDILMHYGTTVTWSRKRRTPVDVPKMIADWTEVVLVLATAHDKADIDKAEFRMDELLSPLLTAPVAQLREFHEGLTTALRANPQVPFFLWSTFNVWGKDILAKCEAKPELKRLRKKLASEIAEMVDEEVRPDITEAIKGALMWRDPDTLKEMKADLKAGAKPKLIGKESCLFLTTQRKGGPEHKVML